MGGSRPKVMPSDAGRRASEVIAQVKRAHEYDMARPSILKFQGTLLPLVMGRWELGSKHPNPNSNQARCCRS
jgi:hypothetical protein